MIWSEDEPSVRSRVAGPGGETGRAGSVREARLWHSSWTQADPCRISRCAVVPGAEFWATRLRPRQAPRFRRGGRVRALAADQEANAGRCFRAQRIRDRRDKSEVGVAVGAVVHCAGTRSLIPAAGSSGVQAGKAASRFARIRGSKRRRGHGVEGPAPAFPRWRKTLIFARRLPPGAIEGSRLSAWLSA